MAREPKRIFTDFVQVYENKLVFYNAPADGIYSHRNSEDYKRKTDNEKFTGYLTKSGKKKIEKRLTAWIFSILSKNYKSRNTNQIRKHYPVFITLTIPFGKDCNDKVIKKDVLELFIKRLQYQFNVKHYFWKAEKTEKLRLHFHVIIDTYIPKEKIQTLWNSVLKKKGFLELHYQKFHNYNPPSTKINAIYKSKFPVAYILKYCSKDEKSKKIDGLVYRFSNSLMHIVNYSNFAFSEICDGLNNICETLNKKTILTDQCKIILLKSQLNFSSTFGKFRESLLSYYYSTYLQLYELT